MHMSTTKHALIPHDGTKTSEKHAAAEDKDQTLLFMHLNDLEINMLQLNDRPKQTIEKVNDELTFVVLNFFFPNEVITT